MTVSIQCNVASVVALEQGGHPPRLLLLKRAKGYLNGEWCHIAGKIEMGETAWQAALRELKEETGLSPLRFYSADYTEQFFEHDLDLVSIVPAFVAYVDASTAPQLNAEQSKFRWVTFGQASELVSLYVAFLLVQSIDWGGNINGGTAALLVFASRIGVIGVVIDQEALRDRDILSGCVGRRPIAAAIPSSAPVQPGAS